MHQGRSGLRQLLRGALRRALARHRRTSLRAGVRPPPVAVAARPAAGLEEAAHDLRQLHERPVSQGGRSRSRRPRVRRHGRGRLARLPGSHQAQLADAQLGERPLRALSRAVTRLAGRLGRGRRAQGPRRSPAADRLRGALHFLRASAGADRSRRSRRHRLGDRRRGRADPARDRCGPNGPPNCATPAEPPAPPSSSSSGAGRARSRTGDCWTGGSGTDSRGRWFRRRFSNRSGRRDLTPSRRSLRRFQATVASLRARGCERSSRGFPRAWQAPRAPPRAPGS